MCSCVPVEVGAGFHVAIFATRRVVVRPGASYAARFCAALVRGSLDFNWVRMRGQAAFLGPGAAGPSVAFPLARIARADISKDGPIVRAAAGIAGLSGGTGDEAHQKQDLDHALK